MKGEKKGRKAICKLDIPQECFDRLSAEIWKRHPVKILHYASRWRKIDVLMVYTWKTPRRRCLISVASFQIAQIVWKSFCILGNNEHTKEVCKKKKKEPSCKNTVPLPACYAWLIMKSIFQYSLVCISRWHPHILHSRAGAAHWSQAAEAICRMLSGLWVCTS